MLHFLSLDPHLPFSVQCVWAASVLAQLAVFAALLIRGHFRRLPFITAYIVANLVQDVFLYRLYHPYAMSYAAFYTAWGSEAVTLVARLLATAEVIHLVIVAYRGIWGLAWRLLALTTFFVTIGVVSFSAGNASWAIITSDRGYHLVFATALVACLMLIQHYQVEVPFVFRSLLIGLCAYSCIKVLINAASPTILYHFKNFVTLWQMLTLVPFALLLFFFAWVLAHPLPEIRPRQATLPAGAYERLTPQLQAQLQQFNTKLIHFFKIEEPRS